MSEETTTNVNIKEQSLDNQNRNGRDKEDVNKNLANDDMFNKNNNQENKSIPAPIQSKVTSKRHQKSKEHNRRRRKMEQSKEEKRLKFRKALDELREGRVLAVAVPRPMD